MANQKCVLMFGYYRWGWTETYYRADASPVAAADWFIDHASSFVVGRALGVYLEAVRCSDEANPRDTDLRSVAHINVGGRREDAPTDPGVIQDTALIRCQAADGTSRHVFMRGLQDDMINIVAGQSVPSPGGIVTINAFRNLLTQNGFYIKKLKDEEDVEWNLMVNVRASVEPAGYTVISTNGEHGILKNDRVYFKGVNKCQIPWLSGQYTVVDATALTITINQEYLSKEAFIAPREAYVREADYEYPAITRSQFVRFTSRDTGRPTVLSRGRRRGNSCRR